MKSALGPYFITGAVSGERAIKGADGRGGMDTEIDRDASKLREKALSVCLVLWMAVGTSTLRIAIWSAGEIVLWHVYGRERVVREHLSITRMRPELMVSNGDVLWGRSFHQFLISLAIWLPLSVGLLLPIYYHLVPEPIRQAFEVAKRKEESIPVVALLWVLALFFLVIMLPMGRALTVGFGSVVAALIWARIIQYRGSELR